MFVTDTVVEVPYVQLERYHESVGRTYKSETRITAGLSP
jgi:hypothetical protein